MFVSIKKYIANYTGFIVRLDDVAENQNWELMDKCEILFDKYNIKPILGIIPNNKDQELLNYPIKNDFWNKVRNWKDKGWEIAMHGYSHNYSVSTNKKDFFGYGGKSEFFGLSYDLQFEKIKKGLLKFKNEGLEIQTFFAPNHTYDTTTFKALHDNGIKYIIDGYGLFPYFEKNLVFFPQLFYKEIFLPFGIQSSQIHINYWDEIMFKKFETFIEKNHRKIIRFDEARKKINNSFFSKILNILVKITLKTIRYIR